MTMWQLILGFALICSSLSVLFEKRVHNIEESNPVAFAFTFQFFVGILFILISFIFGQLKFDNISKIWINILISAVLYGFGNIFYFKGLKTTEASVFTIISNSSSIFTIISSSIFLRQFLNLYQTIGVILIFSSIVLINYSKRKINLNKGLIFTILGAIFFGFSITNDKVILSQLNVFTTLSIGFTLPAVLMMIIYHKDLKHLKFFFKPKIFFKFFIFCVSYLFAALFYFIALQISSNSSQFAGLSLFGTILTVILCVIFLKETNRLFIKILASLISLFGLILIR